MRYYKAITEENLTYKKALKLSRKLGQAMTRPSVWEGIHMEVARDEYKIILKTGEVLTNPDDIWDTGRTIKDWAVVVPTARALSKLGI